MSTGELQARIEQLEVRVEEQEERIALLEDGAGASYIAPSFPAEPWHPQQAYRCTCGTTTGCLLHSPLTT